MVHYTEEKTSAYTMPDTPLLCERAQTPIKLTLTQLTNPFLTAVVPLNLTLPLLSLKTLDLIPSQLNYLRWTAGVGSMH